ncbi:protein POF1B isoform X2 [Chanos chanos]|uniref:Protein POF1B isoform X2 n=1 Tax=Chanos chanos TaxID=29144 RepID=A0A6J2WYC0_CHACN|nr:protein POF1B isoform X2 [Chanos chanos]
MTLPYSHSYRTFSVASEPGTGATVVPVSSVQYVNGAVEGNVAYGGVRYLMPVQRAESYVLVNQSPQVISPVYLQNVQNVQSLQRVSVSSLDETDISRQQVNIQNGGSSTVFSQISSPAKSPEPPAQEVVEKSTTNVVETVMETDVSQKVKLPDFEMPKVEQTVKLDTRFFGELLAEVYRKNSDIYSCISEHVAKIRGRKHLLDSSNDYKMEREEVEALIPKGVSELTKQQIRYLLQTRLTADKTMRLLLTTFSSLREELIHLQDDLRRLETEKEELEKDLSFKADQAQQYDRLLEAVRENNRQLQASLKESVSAQRVLETQVLGSRSSDSSREFRIKELEGSLKALQQENDMLRQRMAGQGSSNSAALQLKTEELSRHYNQMITSLREEKEKELQTLRSQLIKVQTEYSTERSSDKSLQLRITELLSSLEQRESVIKRQEEEIRRLRQEKIDSSNSSSKNVTQTVVTRYVNQYPILGLLSDDYQATSPVRETKTVVIKKTEETSQKL